MRPSEEFSLWCMCNLSLVLVSILHFCGKKSNCCDIFTMWMKKKKQWQGIKKKYAHTNASKKKKRISQKVIVPPAILPLVLLNWHQAANYSPDRKPTKCLQMKKELLEVLTAEACQLHCQRKVVREEQEGMAMTRQAGGADLCKAPHLMLHASPHG